MSSKGSPMLPMAALIMAIPAVACYVWWTHLNAETRRQLTLRVRRRTDGVHFGGMPDRNRLRNPIMPAAARLAAESGPSPIPSQTVAVGGKPAAPFTAVAESTGEAGGQAPDSAVGRDPFVSPYDLVRLEQMELERKQRAEELHRPVVVAARPKRRVVSIESRLDLQGIISVARGNKAIVNGDMVGVGDVVLGARVLRITTQSVAFSYRGRRFVKTISK